MGFGDDEERVWSCPSCPETFTTAEARHAHVCPTPAIDWKARVEEMEKYADECEGIALDAREAMLALGQLVVEKDEVIRKILFSGGFKDGGETLMKLLEAYHLTPMYVSEIRKKEQAQVAEVLEWAESVKNGAPVKQLCAYCGFVAPDSGEIKAHLKTCDKHPMSEMRKAITDLLKLKGVTPEDRVIVSGNPEEMSVISHAIGCLR